MKNKDENKDENKDLSRDDHRDDHRDEYRDNSRRSIFSVIYIFLGLFVLVMGYFTYFLLAKSGEIINSTYNQRHDVLAERVIRGKILAQDYSVLAETLVNEDGTEIRKYPYNDVFVHVVGRYNKGRTGLEETENIQLLTSDTHSVENIYNEMVGDKNLGDNVITTLDTKLQQVAYEGLGDNRGAVVVMEPSTGKILAMVSKPAYDPNEIDQIWEELLKEEEKETKSPLLNRATQWPYPPGSTFKILTALGFIRENPNYLDYNYDCDGKIDYDGMVIHCYNNNAHGKVDLKKSFVKSCNTSFASIGKDLDITKFRSLVEGFLFNKPLPINITSSSSSFELKAGNAGVKETMQTAIGQGKTLITPLHNAMITSAVASGGKMMKPYLVDHIESASGRIIKRYRPELISKPMTLEEADYLAKLMRAVVTDGTGRDLKEIKVKAAGKTGSADQGAGKPAHAWFVGYAPYSNPKIAVSVIVESKGTGSEYAVPIARKIFDAYFGK